MDSVGPEDRVQAPLKPGEEFLTTWSKAILESVTDHMQVEVTDGIAVATIRIPKG